MIELSQDKMEAFEKENGMSVEDAISHTKQWIQEGNVHSAEAAITELEKYISGTEELSELKKLYSSAFDVKHVAESKQPSGVARSSESDITKSDRIIASIGYFGWACLLPLLLRKDSEFCQQHAKQSLLVSIALFLVHPFMNVVPGSLAGMPIHMVYTLFVGGFVGYGVFQASRGKVWVAPLIGDAAKNINLS